MCGSTREAGADVQELARDDSGDGERRAGHTRIAAINTTRHHHKLGYMAAERSSGAFRCKPFLTTRSNAIGPILPGDRRQIRVDRFLERQA